MSQHRGVVSDRFHDHIRQCGPAKVNGTGASFIQQAVHGGERLPGTERGGGKSSIRRQTAMEAPREKDGLLGRVDVRQPPLIEDHRF